MTQHRSITQRLNRAKSVEAKKATLSEWAKSWEAEQMTLISKLGKAISDGNYDQECILIGEIKAMAIKKFKVLPKVLEILMDGQENLSNR